MAPIKRRNEPDVAHEDLSMEELPPLNISDSDLSDNDNDHEEEESETEPQELQGDSKDDDSLEGFDSSDLDELSEEDEENLSSTSESDSDDPDTVLGADGQPRKLRPEIDPHYSSDDSDQEEPNTIGNIPLSAYDKFPHIGYNIDGKRIMRPATQSAIDSLLETIDSPKGWTGLTDKTTGQSLNSSKEEMDLIDRVQKGMLPDDSINPFEDQLEWFSNKPEVMPLPATNEPKRRFVPSKYEAKAVMKLVKAIREGKLVIPDAKEAADAYDIDDDRQMVLNKKLYDVWEKEEPVINRMHLPAPKMPPPTHEESYNPPEEYLMTEEEKEKWEKMDPEDRELNFIPQKFGSLRRVPGYANAVRERFDRCLDLYLAPRARSKRTNVDPESSIPDLPNPDESKPFPIRCSTIYRGHDGLVRTSDVDNTGNYLATGSEDGSVRVWDVSTGRELWRVDVLKDDTYTTESNKFSSSDHIDAVVWHPKLMMSSVAAGENIYLIVPPSSQDIESENAAFEALERGWAYRAQGNVATSDYNVGNSKNGDEDDESQDNEAKKNSFAEWTRPPSKLKNAGVSIVIRNTKRVRHINWHARGDYFVTTQPDANLGAVLVHQLSKHTTQSPFRRSKGLVQDAKFHPTKPHSYVASQRYIRIYNSTQQQLVKKLQPGVKWLATFDIHPGGENVITASYDRRVTWHDLESSDRPYKTLRYHDQAVRDVKFHPKLPLFCSASDDGNINVLHDTVYDDVMKNPLLVPLKILSGHKVTASLGVLQTVWHPREAWLFSAGGDGTARLWTT